MTALRLISLMFVLVLPIVVGCGDDSPPPPPPPVDAGRDTNDEDDASDEDSGSDETPDGGEDAGEDGGSDPMPGCADEGGPEVEIVSPDENIDEPNDEDVLVGARQVVSCRVARSEEEGASSIDPESIQIVLLDDESNVVLEPPVTADGAEFSAIFNLAEVDSGPVRFRCQASDEESTPRCSSDDLVTLLDLGPGIFVSQPLEGSIHSNTMGLRFTVEELKLTDDDEESRVDDVTLTVAGVEFEELEADDGVYAVDIDFGDREVFTDELDGEYEFVIEARNDRSPDRAVRTHRQRFLIDRVGPTIEFISPEDGDLIGGSTDIVVEVKDAAGIDPTSISLRVNMTELDFEPYEDHEDQFIVAYDASEVPRTVVELTLNATATDLAGNLATKPAVVKLDSTPPISSLDPPMVSEIRTGATGVNCSALFDPLGDDSVNDLEVVGTAAEFRVRAEDQGNQPFGSMGTVVFQAGIRSVELFLHDETDVPLLVDTTGDGQCDSMNPVLEPVPGDPSTAVVVDYEGIRPRGAGWFRVAQPRAPMSEGVISPAHSIAGESIFNGCFPPSNEGVSPRALCSVSSPLARVIPRQGSRSDQAIFGKPIVTDSTCIGDAFDFQGSLSEGVACVAVRMTDELNNVSVSRPLRVCFDDGAGDNECGGLAIGDRISESMAPTCTDGCTPPPGFAANPSLQLVNPGL